MMERPWTVVMYIAGRPYARSSFDTYGEAGDCIEESCSQYESFEGFKIQLLRWGQVDSEYKGKK